MKTIRTVRQVVERDEDIAQEPEYAVGDYMEVYSGDFEGHNFWIKDVRFNYDSGCFEYLYWDLLFGGWYAAGQLTLVKSGAAA